MIRRCISLVVWLGLFASAGVIAPCFSVRAQEKPPEQPKPVPQEKPPAQVKPTSSEKQRTADKQVTAEQVAETAIFWFGRREGMAQVRKTGIERGRIMRAVADGKTEESDLRTPCYRGESMDKDRIRVDQKCLRLSTPLSLRADKCGASSTTRSHAATRNDSGFLPSNGMELIPFCATRRMARHSTLLARTSKRGWTLGART